MNKLRNQFALGASALVMAITASPALAQDAAAQADDAGNPEIVVTAQFREQKLQDTPLAITAVNAEMLEARSQTSVEQVAAQAPNVTLTPQGQQNGSGLIAFIRGVGQTDFNFALEPGVGIYVDDVYIPTLTGSLLDLMDLDRIEVLRGPQGSRAQCHRRGDQAVFIQAARRWQGFALGHLWFAEPHRSARLCRPQAGRHAVRARRRGVQEPRRLRQAAGLWLHPPRFGCGIDGRRGSGARHAGRPVLHGGQAFAALGAQ
jgi:hypothetical protein